MGIFKKKKTILEYLQEDIERSEKSLNESKALIKTSMPIFQKYGEIFRHATTFGNSLTIYTEKGSKLNPEIFCDCGKLGLKIIPKSGYGSEWIDISFL